MPPRAALAPLRPIRPQTLAPPRNAAPRRSQATAPPTARIVCSLCAQPRTQRAPEPDAAALVNPAVVQQREGAPTMPMLVRNLRDRLLELRQLRDKALARRDAVQAEELQAEIEELTAYLEEIFEGAVDA